MSELELQSTRETDPRSFYGYIIVAASFFIMLLGMGFYNSFGLFLKPMIAEFGWTRAITAGAFSLSCFIRGSIGIVMGRVNDKLGPRTVLSICGLLLLLGYLLMYLVDNIYQFYYTYVLLIGIGVGCIYVPLLSTVARWFMKNRSTITGIVTSGLSLGTLVCPLLVAQMIISYGWRMSYLIIGLSSFFIIAIAAQFLRREPKQIGQIPYGANIYEQSLLSRQNDGLQLSDAVRTIQFWILAGILFCTGFCRIAVSVHIVPYMTDLGFSTADAAKILGIIGGTNILGNIVGGSAYDRIGGKKTYIVSFVIISATLFWLVKSTDIWMFYLFAVTFGLGLGVTAPLPSPIIAELFGLKSHGMVFGSTNFVYAVGAAIGPFLLGYAFDMTGNYLISFFICITVSIIGLILAITIKPITRISS